MPKRIVIWMQAMRPFAFSASIIPVCLGAAVAVLLHEHIEWIYFPIALFAAVLFHAGTNVISEYFDYKKGVDQKHSFGSGNVLVRGLEKPAVVFFLGAFFFAFGSLLGSFIIFHRGMSMFYIAFLGLLGGVFYTGWPVGYKYWGWGDIMIFFLMGPLMVAGSFLALAGTLKWVVFYISLPVGFLVTAILCANNIRDIRYDREAGVKTFESLWLGESKARVFYAALVVAAYVSVVVMIICGILSFVSGIVFISAPLAFKNVLTMLRGKGKDSGKIATLDVATAQLHMIFGALFILAVILQGIFQ